MIIFVFSFPHWQYIIFFAVASCYFSKLSPCLGRINGPWLKFHSQKLSEICVVCLMEKIITRQVKQSMTHSNQGERLPTQVSREVRTRKHVPLFFPFYPSFFLFSSILCFFLDFFSLSLSVILCFFLDFFSLSFSHPLFLCFPHTNGHTSMRVRHQWDLLTKAILCAKMYFIILIVFFVHNFEMLLC